MTSDTEMKLVAQAEVETFFFFYFLCLFLSTFVCGVVCSVFMFVAIQEHAHAQQLIFFTPVQIDPSGIVPVNMTQLCSGNYIYKSAFVLFTTVSFCDI